MGVRGLSPQLWRHPWRQAPEQHDQRNSWRSRAFFVVVHLQQLIGAGRRPASTFTGAVAVDRHSDSERSADTMPAPWDARSLANDADTFLAGAPTSTPTTESASSSSSLGLVGSAARDA